MTRKLKVGDIFQSTSGNTYTVIENLADCKSKIKFNDEFGYEVVADNYAIRNGRLKNPYYRKLFGKGYFGVGPYKSKLGPGSQGYPNTLEYTAWINMLSRCYYHTNKTKVQNNMVYKDVEVCPEWLNFQTFSEWFTEKYNLVKSKEPYIKIALDKDILSGTSKIYSPETCSIIPSEISMSLIGSSGVLIGKGKINCRLTRNGKYSITLHNRDGTTRGVVGLNSKEDCLNVYMEHKRTVLKELAEKYKHVLEHRVYDRLIQF
jgi:hypothetical protein